MCGEFAAPRWPRTQQQGAALLPLITHAIREAHQNGPSGRLRLRWMVVGEAVPCAQCTKQQQQCSSSMRAGHRRRAGGGLCAACVRSPLRFILYQRMCSMQRGGTAARELQLRALWQCCCCYCAFGPAPASTAKKINAGTYIAFRRRRHVGRRFHTFGALSERNVGTLRTRPTYGYCCACMLYWLANRFSLLCRAYL